LGDITIGFAEVDAIRGPRLMRRDLLLDTTAVVPAVTMAALSGVVFFVLLVLIGRPTGYAARLAEASATAARTGGLEHAPPLAALYPAKAVCAEASQVAAESLRRALQSAAGNLNVSLTNVALTPGSADEAAGGLAPVTLRFEATGQYDAVLGLLGQMGRWRPELFVDSVGLRSQVSSVALKLEGRIFCSTSVRR